MLFENESLDMEGPENLEPEPATATEVAQPAAQEVPAEKQNQDAPAEEVQEEAAVPLDPTKRCSSCGTHYPTGYEACPNCNTKLE